VLKASTIKSLTVVNFASSQLYGSFDDFKDTVSIATETYNFCGPIEYNFTITNNNGVSLPTTFAVEQNERKFLIYSNNLN